MKRKTGRLKEKLAAVFELPPEAAAGATRLILINNTDLFLENHKGIREYTLARVRIHTAFYDLVIRGKDLELKNMGAENLIVTGEIEAIEFEAQGV